MEKLMRFASEKINNSRSSGTDEIQHKWGLLRGGGVTFSLCVGTQFLIQRVFHTTQLHGWMIEYMTIKQGTPSSSIQSIFQILTWMGW